MDDSSRLREAIKQTQLVIDNTEQSATRRHLEQGMEDIEAVLESIERKDKK